MDTDTDHLRLLTPADIRGEQIGVALAYVSAQKTEPSQVEEEKSLPDSRQEPGKQEVVVPVVQEEETLVTEEASKNVTSMLDDFFADD